MLVVAHASSEMDGLKESKTNREGIHIRTIRRKVQNEVGIYDIQLVIIHIQPQINTVSISFAV